MRKIIGVLFYFVILCFSSSAQERIEIISTNPEIFINPETHHFLGRPAVIGTDSTGLLIADRGYMRITKVDFNGNLLHHFGGKGRGPGEFETLTGFWVFENEYLVYDYNNFKFLSYNYSGDLIRERVLDKNPFNPESMYAIPVTVQAFSADRIAVQLLGYNDALFAVADLFTNEVLYIGESIVATKKMNEYEVDREYADGKIPHDDQNFVLIQGDGTYIYSFQQTTGILQKFNLEGEEIWNAEVFISSQEQLFEQISEYNIKMKDRPFVQQYFFKARDMQVTKNGIAILLNMPDEVPLTIAWVSKDGSEVKFLTVKDVNNDRYGLKESFTISPDEEYAYYLKRATGTIYRFSWPF